MNKKNFDNYGLQSLLQELYALPDELLQEEALAASNDFTGWMETHFLLDAAQLNDLQTASPLFLSNMGQSVGSFLAQRLPINLVKNVAIPSAAKKGGRGKLYEKEKKSTVSYTAELGLSTVETLQVSISYLSEATG